MSDWKKRLFNVRNFHISIIDLIDLLPKKKYQSVYGIPRGGLIIAIYISHHFNIPMIIDENNIKDKSTLIVDDIADTGKTLTKWNDLGFDMATIFWKKRSTVKPTYYIFETENWVVFPYEKLEERPNREK